MQHETLDRLKSLHTGAIDARNGYDEALQDAEGHGLTGLFQSMIKLHETNASELAAVLHTAGEASDDNGSFMTTVHRAIMSIRSLFGGLDQSVLPGLIDGEHRNMSHYDEALRLPGLEPSAEHMLTIQRAHLADAVASMERSEAVASKERPRG